MIKKILNLATVAFIATAFMGCTKSDYVYASSYVYVNGSSRDIFVKSYTYRNSDFLEQDPEYTFTLPVGESHQLQFDVEGFFPYPFMWNNPTSSDSLNISNGEKRFGNIRSSRGENKLFREESYEIIDGSKKNRNRTYRYVFTDKDFENAEPIE